MAKFGYHASHEQFKPSQLLTYVRAAEQAGFTTLCLLTTFIPGANTKGSQALLGHGWAQRCRQPLANVLAGA